MINIYLNYNIVVHNTIMSNSNNNSGNKLNGSNICNSGSSSSNSNNNRNSNNLHSLNPVQENQVSNITNEEERVDMLSLMTLVRLVHDRGLNSDCFKVISNNKNIFGGAQSHTCVHDSNRQAHFACLSSTINNNLEKYQYLCGGCINLTALKDKDTDMRDSDFFLCPLNSRLSSSLYTDEGVVDLQLEFHQLFKDLKPYLCEPFKMTHEHVRRIDTFLEMEIVKFLLLNQPKVTLPTGEVVEILNTREKRQVFISTFLNMDQSQQLHDEDPIILVKQCTNQQLTNEQRTNQQRTTQNPLNRQLVLTQKETAAPLSQQVDATQQITAAVGKALFQQIASAVGVALENYRKQQEDKLTQIVDQNSKRPASIVDNRPFKRPHFEACVPIQPDDSGNSNVPPSYQQQQQQFYPQPGAPAPMSNAPPPSNLMPPGPQSSSYGPPSSSYGPPSSSYGPPGASAPVTSSYGPPGDSDCSSLGDNVYSIKPHVDACVPVQPGDTIVANDSGLNSSNSAMNFSLSITPQSSNSSNFDLLQNTSVNTSDSPNLQLLRDMLPSPIINTSSPTVQASPTEQADEWCDDFMEDFNNYQINKYQHPNERVKMVYRPSIPENKRSRTEE